MLQTTVYVAHPGTPWSTTDLLPMDEFGGRQKTSQARQQPQGIGISTLILKYKIGPALINLDRKKKLWWNCDGAMKLNHNLIKFWIGKFFSAARGHRLLPKYQQNSILDQILIKLRRVRKNLIQNIPILVSNGVLSTIWNKILLDFQYCRANWNL